MPDNINLFALVEDDDVPVRRIPLTAKLATDLQQFFTAQQNYFLADKQQIDFAGGYNTDGGELFIIKEYSLPDSISSALSNPLPLPILNLDEETRRIKALFSGVWTNGSKTVNFQVFDSSKLLKKGFTLIGSGDTYKKLEEPGLILQDKLAAHYADGTLYFSSYHVAKRFLDLDAYYREATDGELETFAASSLFAFEDAASFKQNADSIVRTKVALLQSNKVLDELSVSDIQTEANIFNQGLSEHNISIRIDQAGKLVIPKDKKQLKELLRFLNDEYGTTQLSKRKCMFNSKKYL